MLRARHILAAGAMLALAGCVNDDPYYGYSGSGYSGPRSYDSYDRRASYDRGNQAVDCNLPGEDEVMRRRDCRRLQREVGRSEADAERRGYR
jgi:hypothetical protein